MKSFRTIIKEWAYTGLGLATATAILLFALLGAHLYAPAPELAHTDVQSVVASSSDQRPIETPIQIVTSKPVRLVLPTVNLAVDIDDATIDISSNEWPLSHLKAQYANFTPALGSTKGTMLIYGHNTWAVMRKSGDLKIGDELVIIDQNQKTWRFSMTKEDTILPENVGFIYEDTPFRIVMFTCDGWNDTHRRLMYFSPVV